VLAELDLDVVLDRVLDAARELTGARYAALGVLNAARTGLDRFVTAGLDEEAAGAIAAPPRGHGLLGEVIRNPVPVRLADVGEHPLSYGFPAGHPPMRTFLGVPIFIAGEPFGNLYLTEKHAGQGFTTHDEEAVVVLAEFAGLAIDHARRYSRSEARRGELQRTVDALDAAVQVSRALAGQLDLEKVLELAAKRARALVSARTLVIELREREDLVIGAAVGEVPAGLLGQRLKLRHTVTSKAMLTSTTQRIGDPPTLARFREHGLGKLGVRCEAGVVVPLGFRGRAYGALVALDRLEGGPAFTDHDQWLLEWFVASAATSLVTALVVSAEREHERFAAAERERGRWARELHDGTLQRLAGLRLELASAQRTADRSVLDHAVTAALEALQSEIKTLRSLSFELRPAILDELGTESAIAALSDMVQRSGINVELDLHLPPEREQKPTRHAVELETAIYRIVQEALANVQEHANATRATVAVKQTATNVQLTVTDDGSGFDPADTADGYGFAGIRDRIELLGGELRVDSAPGNGTTLHASLPLHEHDPITNTQRVTPP
jgi:signal transduction histidine kinase